MQISKIIGNATAETVEVKTFDDFASFAKKHAYSLSVFNGRRNLDGFVKAEAIGLDFDEGMTIEEAERAFAEYMHIIMPTRNHRKEKNGKIADRFRVVLFLESPITDEATFSATWRSLHALFPACDEACKDPARQFFPSTGVASINKAGKRVSVVAPAKEAVIDTAPVSTEKGQLAMRTCRFLAMGAPKGKRHDELYFSAIDAKQNGYTKAEFIERVELMARSTKGIDWPHEGHKATIDDVFDNRDPKHAARVVKPGVNFVDVDVYLENQPPVKWVVDGLLYEGGLSVLAGAPKSGKSTLTKQLARAVARGEAFLGRTVSKGTVFYMAMEEEASMLHEELKALGIKKGEAIKLHVGRPTSKDPVEEVAAVLEEKRPTLLIVDTLFLLVRVANTNSYEEVNDALARLRDIARATRTHILTIHHINKSVARGTTTIMGSNAIHGAVDNAMLFVQEGQQRFLTTSQRGGKSFYDKELLFDEKTQTYSIGQTRPLYSAADGL